MEYSAITAILILLQLMIFAMLVGRTRVSAGIKAPATSGDPIFERYFRVHQNSLENAVIVIPALFIFNYYFNPRIGAALGLVYIIGRFAYMRGYVSDPTKRGKGFSLSFLCEIILLVGALVGAVMAAIA